MMLCLSGFELYSGWVPPIQMSTVQYAHIYRLSTKISYNFMQIVNIYKM